MLNRKLAGRRVKNNGASPNQKKKKKSFNCCFPGAVKVVLLSLKTTITLKLCVKIQSAVSVRRVKQDKWKKGYARVRKT